MFCRDGRTPLAGLPLGHDAPHRATYCVPEPLVVRRLLMILGVVFCGLVAVVGRMQSMRVGDVSVMSGLLMIAGFIMLGRSR